MSDKAIIWLFTIIGSSIGGFIPELWGAGFLSFSSLILSAVGALAGIYIGFRLTH